MCSVDAVKGFEVLRFDRTSMMDFGIRKPVVAVIVGMASVTAMCSTAAVADPAEDAVAKLNQLSRQAEQLTESIHSAEIDLDKKVLIQDAADRKHTEDLAALDAAKARLSTYQGNVSNLAASVYMGGRTDGLNAFLTAASPQNLIDKMSIQRVMAHEMADSMSNFRAASQQAGLVEGASATSAADAKAAAEEAAAVRAELQRKQSDLRVQIASVRARYAMLTPVQQAALAAPAAPPPSVLARQSDVAALAALPHGGGGSGAGAVAVQAALSRLGDPYVWGGSGPGAFDCSGLVMWAFQQSGVSLPHSSQMQSGGGRAVSVDQMQPGDIVSYYSDASHVGLYIGDGMIVHASTFGVPVAVSPVNNAPIYNVRRY
jgi:cell wall-associated NlpC family hydrolase